MLGHRFLHKWFPERVLVETTLAQEVRERSAKVLEGVLTVARNPARHLGLARADILRSEEFPLVSAEEVWEDAVHELEAVGEAVCFE